MEPHLKPAKTTPQPLQLVELWWNSWNPRGSFLKPARTTPQPLKKLVEPWWILVEPWWNPGGTLVETLPQTTPDHPAALAEPGGTVVEPSWNLRGTTPDRWNPGGTLVEPWWNPDAGEPWWNLSSGSPRTTPEPIWAETPKLSAVGGKKSALSTNPQRSFHFPHSSRLVLLGILV